MNDIAQRVVHLLRSAPAPVLPLARVHAALATDSAAAARSSRARLYDSIRRRPDLFMVLEPEAPPWGGDEWPPEVRREYEDALRAAGVDIGPRVALAHSADGTEAPPADAPEPGADHVLRLLEDGLLDLWTTAATDVERRAEVLEAIVQADRLRQALRSGVTSPSGPGPASSGPTAPASGDAG